MRTVPASLLLAVLAAWSVTAKPAPNQTPTAASAPTDFWPPGPKRPSYSWPKPPPSTVTVTYKAPPPYTTLRPVVTTTRGACPDPLPTTSAKRGHACPDICIDPASASELCPEIPIACPAEFATCPPGETHTFIPVGLSSVLSTETAGCTATVVWNVPCQTCGCPTPGCTVCMSAASKTASAY